MKKICEWLADHKFDKLSILLCEITGGHDPVFYNSGGIEPDMNCKHCSGDLY